MTDRPVRRHYAFAVTKVKGGYRVDQVIEFPSRGEADHFSLRLLARHGDAASITLDRELVVGDVLDPAQIGR
jgi:hypothetical protein